MVFNRHSGTGAREATGMNTLQSKHRKLSMVVERGGKTAIMDNVRYETALVAPKNIPEKYELTL